MSDQDMADSQDVAARPARRLARRCFMCDADLPRSSAVWRNGRWVCGRCARLLIERERVIQRPRHKQASIPIHIDYRPPDPVFIPVPVWPPQTMRYR